MAFRRARAHHLVGAQLLLPVRQRGRHPRARREPASRLYHLRRGAPGSERRARQEAYR